jgi:hypothetical protein
MHAFNLNSWPEDMRPNWLGMVDARAACPQGCKTTDQAEKWEEIVKNMIKEDMYAVCPVFNDKNHTYTFHHLYYRVAC